MFEAEDLFFALCVYQWWLEKACAAVIPCSIWEGQETRIKTLLVTSQKCKKLHAAHQNGPCCQHANAIMHCIHLFYKCNKCDNCQGCWCKASDHSVFGTEVHLDSVNPFHLYTAFYQVLCIWVCITMNPGARGWAQTKQTISNLTRCSPVKCWNVNLWNLNCQWYCNSLRCSSACQWSAALRCRNRYFGCREVTCPVWGSE